MQEEENPAFRAGKRQVFPTCEPDRVTAEALKRRNNGFSLPDLGLQRRLIGSLSLIRIFEENLDINPLTGIRRQWNIGFFQRYLRETRYDWYIKAVLRNSRAI